MDQQGSHYTAVRDWHVRTRKQAMNVPGAVWEKCCDRWEIGVPPLAAAQSLHRSHQESPGWAFRIEVYAGDADADALVLTFEDGTIYTPDTIEGFTEEGFQATYGVNYDKVSGPDDTLADGGPQPIPDDIKVRDAKTGEEITGAEREEILTAARQAVEDGRPLVTAFQLVTEDQLKRAAVELEGTLKAVTDAQEALARKGSWWCYQDALRAMARATSVYTAAYLNWEATL